MSRCVAKKTPLCYIKVKEKWLHLKKVKLFFQMFPRGAILIGSTFFTTVQVWRGGKNILRDCWREGTF